MEDRSTGYRIFTVFNYIILAAIAFACLYPFYYVVVASISDPEELLRHSGLLLKPVGEITFGGYQMVFNYNRVMTGFMNTFFILIVGLCINIVMTALGGYVLSLKDLMLRKPLSIFVIVTMYFSGGMIPTYLNIRSLGLMDSLWSLIIPGAITTSNMLIMRSAFMAVPDSLPEAAKLDGASHLQILLNVMMPLVKATTAVMVLYYGVAHWNAWFNASIYLSTPSKFPLQLVLRNILVENQTGDMLADVSADRTPQMQVLLKYSLIVVSTVPMLVIYPFLQRFFKKGVMIGAVKG